jgi:hypothetical protein
MVSWCAFVWPRTSRLWLLPFYDLPTMKKYNFLNKKTKYMLYNLRVSSTNTFIRWLCQI